MQIKKVLSVLLVAVMLLSVMPFTAFATDDTTGTKITEAVADGNYYSLTFGTWYIDEDTNIDKCLRITSGDVVVNLNGHTLRYSGSNDNSVFYVTGGNLTVNNGTVTGGKGNTDVHGGDGLRGGAFALTSTSLTTLNNVTITDNQADWGGGIFLDNSDCSVILNHSAITNNRVNSYWSPWGGDGGAIFFDGGSATLNDSVISNNVSENGNRPGIRIGESCRGIYISGNTVIYDNIVNNNQQNLYIGGDVGGYGNFSGVTVTGELGENAKIGVTMENPSAQAFTATAQENLAYNDPAGFTSDSETYHVVKSTSEQLILVQASNIEAYGFNGVYDGNPHGITVNVIDPSDAEVNYGTTKGTYNLTESPTYTEIGTYPVYYQTTVKSMAGEYIVIEGAEIVNIQAGVNFLPNGASGTMDSIIVTNSVTLPENGFTNTVHYVFSGWLCDDDNQIYQPGDTVSITKVVTNFTAQWTEVPVYTVTFNSNGGSAVDAQELQTGTKAVKPAKPTKAGYHFVSWQLSGVDFDFNTPITQNITLTAVWGEGISEETSFDNGIPDGWTQSSSDGNYQWRIGVGDQDESTGTHSGDTNALITHVSSGSTAYLIMPLMDLSSTAAATIDCWYINRDWGGDIDEFGVYYRVNGGEWQEIWATGSGSAHGSWTELSIDLPSAAFVSNVEIGFKATDGYGFGVGLDDVVFEASSASAEPNNGYSLTLDDGINVNFLIDTDFYGAEDGYIEYEYIKSSTTESAEREGGRKDVATLPTYNGGNVYDGDSQLTLKAAPAQIAEDYIIRVYNKDSELQKTFTVSIADYCEKMQDNATCGELMTALLNYGQLANEYFGYAAKVEGDYEVPHTANYKADLSAEETAALDSLAAASIVNQGTAQVTGVSYIAQMNPEFKFFFTGTSATTAEVSGDLSATVEKTNTGATVKVTGLNASDFGKTFTVTVDGTVLEYNGYAYLKAAMNSAALKDLAQGIFRYAQAADKTFN